MKHHADSTVAGTATAQDEQRRIDEAERREKNWTRWGGYLAERQWGTVREDYSATGECWTYLPHDHARSRAYRWGEDGLFGITDRECRLCFAVALWNGRDPILKERLFGLSGPEGNHGEDVKELYYYLDATPTSSYLKGLYKYPQAEFPYGELVAEGARRTKADPEFDLEDTGLFDDGRYFDVTVEYAKAGPDDILVRITCANRGPDAATLHLLPTLWQRNTWSWGREGEGYWDKGRIARHDDTTLAVEHPSMGKFRLACEPHEGVNPRFLFADNETNAERLFQSRNASPFVKDAFHRHVVNGEQGAVNPDGFGTKAAAWHTLEVAAGAEAVVRLRLSSKGDATEQPFGEAFDAVFAARIAEADAFFAERRSGALTDEERRVVRQADAGLLWSKQFYHFVVDHWLHGDPAQPAPPRERLHGRNARWDHLYARDLLSMPDKWEYPWFAAWDTAFHCVAMARVDAGFAKRQILLLCREWYMHPNGQLPAYEFAFGDVNPPVHAWAAWRVYSLSKESGRGRDVGFLESAFQKCLVNFTWWVNRKDTEGNNLFAGGFLGLDNVGVFDRSQPLPGGGRLDQADGTAWMAFYCTTMLAMALELARDNDAYADIASKFFEHFVAIAQAMNRLGGHGLWDAQDGFYYDLAHVNDQRFPMRVRSVVGLIPLFAAESIEEEHLQRLPLFKKRLQWFVENKPEIVQHVTVPDPKAGHEHRILSIPTREQLTRVLRYVLDEAEFLSPHGVRSLSRVHAEHPYVVDLAGSRHEVHYAPAESDTGMFGGNSNWRGPVWMPINYLLIEALKRHHHFYGDTFQVECPVGSGQMVTLLGAAEELERRLASIFLPDGDGNRPCHGGDARYTTEHFRDLVLFHEYFHGDNGRGLGASHQTGWTALAANVIERMAETRARKG